MRLAGFAGGGRRPGRPRMACDGRDGDGADGGPLPRAGRDGDGEGGRGPARAERGGPPARGGRVIDRPDVLVLGAGGALAAEWMHGVLAGIAARAGIDFRRV